jgi:hypothetical protein
MLPDGSYVVKAETKVKSAEIFRHQHSPGTEAIRG